MVIHFTPRSSLSRSLFLPVGRVFPALAGLMISAFISGDASACAPLTITLNSLSASQVQVCASAGGNVTVTFSGTSDGAGSGTTSITYRAELSNSSGSFAAPVTIGTLVYSGCAPSSQAISATIPAGTATGTLYRIRVANASNAVVSGSLVVSIKNTTVLTSTIAGSPFCAGTSVNVPFTVCGTINGGNIFTAELSDKAGSFASPVNIGTLAGTTNGTVSAAIPAGTQQGTGYRIRVTSSNPASTGTDNGANLTINTTLVTGPPYPVPICPGGNIQVPYTVGGAPCTTFAGGNVFTAQLSDASGSFASPVNIGTLASTASGTISATIPVGTPYGTGYRIRIVSSNPVVTGLTNTNSGIQTKQMVAYASGGFTITRTSGADQFSAADANQWFWWNDGRAPFKISYLTANSVGTSVSTGLTPATPGTKGIIIDTSYDNPAGLSVFPYIATGAVTSPICPGSAVNVTYSIGAFCAVFNASNDFTAQLSDASGSFASPTNIGSLNNTTINGTIAATIPAGTSMGTGYRIRVVSSSPAYTGWDNGTDLGSQSITTTVTGAPFCANDNYTYNAVSFTAGCPSSILAGNVYSAELSTAAGTFPGTIIGTLSSTASSGTISVVIPAATTPSSNYRIRVKSSNSAFTGSDNGTDITVSSCALGTVSFIETVGESAGQSAIYSVQLAASGGYTVAGNAGTTDANPGDYYATVMFCSTQDLFLASLSSDGSILWQKTYAVNENNPYWHVIRHEKTSDGGYIISGGLDIGAWPSTHSYPFLMKTAADGTLQWGRTFDYDSWSFSVKQTADGGYISCGPWGYGYSVPSLMKLDAAGTITWREKYGTNGGAICCTSQPRAVRQTADGGYAMLSTGADYTMGGRFDLIKVNSAGTTVQWSSSYSYGTGAGQGSGGGFDMQITSDGGFILSGNTLNGTSNSLFMVKTNSAGTVSWGRSYMYNSSYGGGMSNAVQQTSDGGYIVTGTTETLNGTHEGDVILLKVSATASLTWAKAFDIGTLDRGMDVKQTTDGGYAVAAYTSSYSNQGVLIRADGDGNSVCCGRDIMPVLTAGTNPVTAGAVPFGTTPAALTLGSTVQTPVPGGTVSVSTICASLPQAVLPVRLLAFSAKEAGDGTVLASWKTAGEANNDYFVVERSIKGPLDGGFEPIGKVKGGGASPGTGSYSFIDRHPAAGVNYYRLRQVDLDGQSSYSYTVSVTIEAPGEFSVSLHPNPAGSDLYCEMTAPVAGTVTFHVTDIFGREVLREEVKAVKGASTNKLTVGMLPQGMYLLRADLPVSGKITGEDMLARARFIKQ